MAWTKKSLLFFSVFTLIWIIFTAYKQPLLFAKIILTSSFIELYIVTISAVLTDMNETYLFVKIKFMNRILISISFITFSIIMQNIESILIVPGLFTFCLINEIYISWNNT